MSEGNAPMIGKPRGVGTRRALAAGDIVAPLHSSFIPLNHEQCLANPVLAILGFSWANPLSSCPLRIDLSRQSSDPQETSISIFTGEAMSRLGRLQPE